MGKLFDILMFTSERVTCDICKRNKHHGLCVEGAVVDVHICDDCAGRALVSAVREERNRKAAHKTVGKSARARLPHGSKGGRR